MNNFLHNLKLNFIDVAKLVLNEEVERMTSIKTSNIALNVEGRGLSLGNNLMGVGPSQGRINP